MEEEKQKALRQLGTRIKTLRKERQFSQESLADAASIERSYMGAIERGERNPTFFKLFLISKALKLKIRDLFD